MKFALIDTFNNVVLSLHRLERCAEEASEKHDRDIRRNNGDQSYIPKMIIEDSTHTLVVGQIYEQWQLDQIRRQA